MISIISFSISYAHAQIETSNQYGSVKIEQEILEIRPHETIYYKISGNINDLIGGAKLTVIITDPEGSTLGLQLTPTSKGYFETYSSLNNESPSGQYKVSVSYHTNLMGSVFFTLKEIEFSEQELYTARGTSQEPELMTSFTGTISAPAGSAVPGCEETNQCFIPADVTINVGGTVTWSNDDTAAHTVTSGTAAGGPDGNFDSSLFMAGDTFSHTFDEAGEYDYFCMVHPWMAGKITVGQTINFQNSEPELEPEPKPVCGLGTVLKNGVCVVERPKFVDPNKDPSYYIDRYLNEPGYKDWFDRNYPNFTIFEAVGMTESEYYALKNKVSEEEISQPSDAFNEPYFETVTTDTNSVTPLIGLEIGQWVKYRLHVDFGSSNEFMEILLNKQLSKSIGGADYSIEDIEWIKMEVISTDGSQITIQNEIKVRGKNNLYTNTAVHSYQGFNFFNLFVPTNVQKGDILAYDEFLGNIRFVDFQKKNFGGKLVDTIHLSANQEFEDIGGYFETNLESFYEKKTGMLLESNMDMTLATLLGGFAVDFGLKALDYHIPSTATRQTGGGCLIATATFGTELAPQVQMLREIRDNSLLQTESGSAFMESFNQFYYSFSPTITDWERENPVFKEIVKLAITPLISSLSILNYVDMDSESEVLVYGISLILLNVGMYFVLPAIVIHRVRKFV